MTNEELRDRVRRLANTVWNIANWTSVPEVPHVNEAYRKLDELREQHGEVVNRLFWEAIDDFKAGRDEFTLRAGPPGVPPLKSHNGE
jgi:hypothetical protein